MPTIISRIQGPVQALLRPGVWLPGIRSLHSCSQTWFVPGATSAEQIARACELAMRALAADLPAIVTKATNTFVQGFSYTRAEWLDVIELRIRPQQDGCLIKAWSFSSGFLPTSIPLTPLLNMVFCFFPFSDVGYNKARLDKIRNKLAEGDDSSVTKNIELRGRAA